jgi:hypothetical protein
VGTFHVVHYSSIQVWWTTSQHTSGGEEMGGGYFTLKVRARCLFYVYLLSTTPGRRCDDSPIRAFSLRRVAAAAMTLPSVPSLHYAWLPLRLVGVVLAVRSTYLVSAIEPSIRPWVSRYHCQTPDFSFAI